MGARFRGAELRLLRSVTVARSGPFRHWSVLLVTPAMRREGIRACLRNILVHVRFVIVMIVMIVTRRKEIEKASSIYRRKDNIWHQWSDTFLSNRQAVSRSRRAGR